MLRIEVNLHPYGSRLAETLHLITIVNDGTGTKHHGNYDATVDDCPVRVENFLRSRGALALLSEVIQTAKEDGCHNSDGTSKEVFTHSMKL